MSFSEIIGLLIALLAFFILGSGKARAAADPKVVIPPPAPPLPKRKKQVERPLPMPVKRKNERTDAYVIRKPRSSSTKKNIRSAKSLKTFIVMKEILDKPKGL